MLGAIFGDIVGSHYEFDPTKNYDFRLAHEDSRPTDDTVMTIAVAKALMETYGEDDETIRRAVVKYMRRFGRKYKDAGYGGRFYLWLDEYRPQPYNSFGNGSGMRVSPVGWIYQTLEDTLHYAKLTVEVTHNHVEGIKGAQAIAAAIYLARNGRSKDYIKDWLSNTFHYDLDRTLDDIRPTYEFDVTCQGSVPEAIIAFLESDSYEDAIRKAVSLGGDADTQACMAGAIAEAFYGDVPEAYKELALSRLPTDLWEVATAFERFVDEEERVYRFCSGIKPYVPGGCEPWKEEMTFEEALEFMGIDLKSPEPLFYTACVEFENAFLFGWKEPLIQNVCVVFKDDRTRTYDPAHSMPLYTEPGEFVQEYDLEALAK